MPYPFNQQSRFSKTLIALTTIVTITLFLFLAFLPNPPTTPDSTKQLVAVNLASSYLDRLQKAQSITEPSYFEDQLTINDQLYKGAVSEEMALAELNKYAGSQFDPALVNVFEEYLKERK